MAETTKKPQSKPMFKKIGKASVMGALKGLGVGVPSALVGGYIGAILDRASLPLGVLTLGSSFLVQNDRMLMKVAMISAGVGMIVGQGFSEKQEEAAETTEGLSGYMDDAKNKGVNFFKAIGKKASLDKIPTLKKKLALGNIGESGDNSSKTNFFKGKNFDDAEAEVDRLIKEIDAEGNVNGTTADSNLLLNGTTSDNAFLMAGTDEDILLNGPSDADMLMAG